MRLEVLGPSDGLRDLDARTVRTTERLHGDLEDEMLAHQIVETDLVATEDLVVVLFDGRLARLVVWRGEPENCARLLRQSTVP